MAISKRLFQKLLGFFLFVFCLNTNAQFIGKDKQAHFFAGGFSSSIAYELTYEKNRNKKKALKAAIITSVVVGGLKEIYDSQKFNNHFDYKDWGYTILGGVSIGLTFNIINTNKNEKINNRIVRNYRKHKRKQSRKEK